MIKLFQDILSSAQTPSSLLETEHALVMLLLLYGLLIYRGKNYRWVYPVILLGILLSIITPVHQIDLFWPVITGLVVPPLLWQGAVAVTKSGPLRRQWSLAVWALTLLLVAFSLRVFSAQPFSNALLLGMLVVSLVWFLRELYVERTYLSTLGKIALVVLLVEIDLAVLSLDFWLGTLISGVAVGIAVGFIGIFLFRKLKQFKWKNYFFFGWAYAAYLAGIVFETSAIATTLAAALVVATYGYSTGLWSSGKEIPVPSNTPIFFYLAAGVWLTLGWQAHTVVDLESLAGIPAVLAAITIGILINRKISPISSENRWLRLLRKETSVLLLLVGSLLLWPRQAFLTTISVEIALAAALFLIILLRSSIKPIFEFFDIQFSWPGENLG